jgi:hypothetical protein
MSWRCGAAGVGEVVAGVIAAVGEVAAGGVAGEGAGAAEDGAIGVDGMAVAGVIAAVGVAGATDGPGGPIGPTAVSTADGDIRPTAMDMAAAPMVGEALGDVPITAMVTAARV